MTSNRLPMTTTRRDALRALSALSITTIATAGCGATPSHRSSGFFAEHDTPIGVQLYTVGELARDDLDATFAKLQAIGFRSVELAGLHGSTPVRLHEAALRHGLQLTGIHLQATGANGDPGLDAAPGQIAATLLQMGITEATLPLMPLPFGPDKDESFLAYLVRAGSQLGEDDWKRAADFLNAHAGALRKEGIRLGYHNHNFEFRPLGSTTGWDVLLAHTDPALVDFELDAGWAAAAGLDPTEVLLAHPGRFRQIHVKDIRPTAANFALHQEPTEVGRGILAWRRILPAAWKAGVRRFYVEQEPPFNGDRFDSLSASFNYLSERV